MDGETLSVSWMWVWLYAGAFMMLLELASPGFVMFFFGLAGVSVGLCAGLFGEVYTLVWQFATFPVFTLLYLVFLRRYLKKIFHGEIKESRTDFSDEFSGRTGTVTEAINPPSLGRVMIGDAEWTAEAEIPIEVGKLVKVISQHNLTMKVEEMK